MNIGNALARELGLEAVVFKVAFDGLILAVQGGRVDLINSGSYISAARQEQVDFIPYLNVGETVVVPAANNGSTTFPWPPSGIVRKGVDSRRLEARHPAQDLRPYCLLL
ncbi:MAG: transporter substrate-binding domain-containing protein [Mesorhizobium sp.]|nr:MAG: transporter substrate-binding domain-containing protein [Mesorhizobium sp.]